MTDLLSLAARVEALAGPDRAVDAEAHRAVTPELADTVTAMEDKAVAPGWCAGGDHDQPTKAPRYTGSIDAALTLVPDGLWWLLGKGKTRPDEPLFGAQILHPNGKVVSQAENDSSPALALLAAALRARAAGGGDADPH